MFVLPVLKGLMPLALGALGALGRWVLSRPEESAAETSGRSFCVSENGETGLSFQRIVELCN